MKQRKLTGKLLKRAEKVKFLLMDCDGVLTDGRLYFSRDGEELKTFHVHDGQGIKRWHKAGFQSGIITGRKSEILIRRADELGINYLTQNSRDKVEDSLTIIEQAGVTLDEVAYLGDDISDASLLGRVGFPILVADAVIGLESEVGYITSKNGGFGAVREVVDLLLDSKEKRSME